MKRVVIISLIYFMSSTSIFAVSNISDMVSYKFSSNVGNSNNTAQTTVKSVTDDEESSSNVDDISNDKNIQYKYNDNISADEFGEGASLYDITSVGIKENKRYKDCLEIKKFGQGTWQSYCQPVKKLEKCTASDWNNIKSLAILPC